MPIRENEKFAACFIADTEEEANRMIDKFDNDISMLAIKRHTLTGIDANDLKQEGLIGLARANRDFEESRSESFRIFALYKIKDAMREFITKEASNIKTPQYIKDATYLIESLKKVIEKVWDIRYMSYDEVWDLSENIQVDSPEIRQGICEVKNSLNNLAKRSCSSVLQLLERAEIMPRLTIEVEDYAASDVSDVYEEETNMMNRLSTKESMEVLKEILEPSELELLWDRYVEGITERELEAKLGVTAPTIDVRTKNILEKVRKHRNRILRDETNTTVKETEQGQYS
jgi:RNA polymerase sigma factor (sigma-70 family)